MYCENCGSEVDYINKTCHGCGIRIDGIDIVDTHRSTADIEHIADTIKKKEYCQHCGNVIENGNTNIPKIKIPAIDINIKKSGIAAVLSSIIPGLGQIYRGRIGAGSIFLIIGLTLIEINKLFIENSDVRMLVPDIRNAVASGIRETIPDIRIIMFIVIYIIFWVYNIHHAYISNPEEVERRIKKQIEREIEKM